MIHPSSPQHALPSVLAPAVLAFMLTAGNARAWDDFGHMVVAAVAFKHLTRSAKAGVDELLKQNPRYQQWIAGVDPHAREVTAFMRAATWADSIKKDAEYRQDEPTSSIAGQ